VGVIVWNGSFHVADQLTGTLITFPGRFEAFFVYGMDGVAADKGLAVFDQSDPEPFAGEVATAQADKNRRGPGIESLALEGIEDLADFQHHPPVS